MAPLQWLGLVFVLCSCVPTSQAKCGGRTVLTDLQGTIQDGPSKYPQNTLCEWLIRGPYPNITITLEFKEFITECSYDYLFIHDGDSYLSPLIGAISGKNSVQTVVAHSGQMLINLYSDFNYSLEGFVANYTIENCTRGCSNHGTCKDGFCQCDNLWRGKACDLEACPSHCLAGQGHGHCNASEHSHCVCNPGFIGESCSLSTLTDFKSNNWFTISSTSSVFSPRTAHSVVYVEKSDTLLAFGGYTLNAVLDDLLQFDFVTSLWREVHAGSPKPGYLNFNVTDVTTNVPDFTLCESLPSMEGKSTFLYSSQSYQVGRFSHTANLYLDAMVVFGGELQGGNLTNDLWLYNLTLNKWTELAMNDTVKPPPLAEHSATLVDDVLYIFGGRTNNEPFSSDMYSYSLSSQTGWTKILYHGGNELHLRMLGHTAVYYADLHSLVVFGGFVPHRARSGGTSNRLLAFHLDHQVWAELTVAGDIPRGHSFHSAVLVGDYVVIYGGNVHIHKKEEICHDNSLLFYHLKCHKWISPPTFDALSPSSGNPQQGRFSHGAVLRNGSVMLVVGGFSGLPLGDVLGFKLPSAIAEKSSSGGHCGGYSTEKSCKEDPECGWCNTLSKCLSLDQSGSCSSTLSIGSCPGSCAVHAQCSACLLVGNAKCGWCVEDSRCYPKDSLAGACHVVSSQGWWGDIGHFLTSPNECQTMDFPPGITVIENVQYPNSSFPDGVRIVSTSEVEIFHAKVSSADRVRLTQLKGFVYPFKNQSAPWKSYELYLKVSNAQYSDATLQLGTNDTEASSELVAHCYLERSCSEKAKRRNNQPLFPSPSEDKRYYIRAEVREEIASVDSTDSVLSIESNRSSAPYKSKPIGVQFLQPFASSNCSVYTTCLACMTDASCGWCMTSCMSRHASPESCQDSDGNARNLTLNATMCTICSDHVDCHSCVQGGDCAWGIINTSLGCYRKGRKFHVDSVIQNCSSPCSSRKTCDSCLSDKVGCAWCDTTQSCFVLGTYTSRYPFGQCSHWIDSFTGGQCLNCSKHTSCKSCLADVRCGWCGNDYDPRIGRCYAGDFNSPYNGQCSDIFPTNGSTVWSYPECPDVDECKLGIAQCHHNATCINVPDSFNCICNRGFTGDGMVACNKTCYHDCGEHGVCGADFICDCDLGWLGENCSIDCGCNGHSDCPKGIGICDKCQDNTRGTHCEFCIPGTFGNATTAQGCQLCKCNGHGDPEQGFCDMVTGKCFCTNDTMGDSCGECKPGLKGNPINGGLCFHECDTRSILTNITQGFISTQLGAGVTNKAKASCLWLISSLSNSSHDVVFGPSPPPLTSRGQITLTFKELRINCLTDHVDVYDGLPPFILGDSSPVQSFYKLGSFCGWHGAELKSVTATLGNMVVLISASLSSDARSKSFSAKFSVKKCPDLCDGNHRCVMSSRGEECVCIEGWTGDNCDQAVCPNNCSLSLGQGHCNLTLDSCVCTDGFTGPDCNQVITPGKVLWEVLNHGRSLNISTNYLARMGHSMVHGAGVLLAYAGYSLGHELLNDLQRFNLSSNTWSLVEVNQLESSIPSARYLHSAVLYIDSMLIYGGMTENGADDSLWSFNLTSVRWSKLPSEGPKVAGHSATLAGNEMYIIGGYDRILGFNERSYVYNVDTKEWKNLTTSGPSPKGIYGHTAVYYPATGIILVFGGYRFRVHTVSASGELYSLDHATGKWSILQALPSNEPQPKYFHSAAIMDDFMVVFGGRSDTNDQFFSHELLVYNVKCNYWQLLSDNRILGNKPGGLISTTAVEISSKIYLFGGFDGETQATLFRLSLPTDLCRSINTREDCTAVRTCSWCDVYNITQGGNDTFATNKSACFSVTSPVPAICHAEPNVTQVVFYNGTDCSEPSDRACDTFSSCSTCLASFPYASLNPNCAGWCAGCSAGGKCVKSSNNCHQCVGNQHSLLTESDKCLANNCEATTCLACLGLDGNCLWTPQLKWNTEVSLYFDDDPYKYDWNCWGNLANQDSLNLTVMIKTSDNCPQPCTARRTCSSCLSSREADAGWKACTWSESLGQCFSPSYVPMVCLGGRCGRIIDGSSSNCMGSCLNNDRCSSCMSNYNCGWCGKRGITGEGQCFEGGVHGPLLETCEGRNATNHLSRVWASTLCPLENECLNGRHSCNMTTQLCVDIPKSFECVCRPGYNDTGHPGTCVPVCSKGCHQGRCVRPEVCECYFGWTSANCSVKCQCNEHGQCANETLLDVCHDCRNHTVGQSCEYCEALYVGDARNNGSCVSCYDVCSHKADVCMNSTQLEYGRNQNLSFEHSEVKRWLKHGPYKIEHEGECLCKNNSKGRTCDSCVSGFFDLDDSCTRCLCNGHADSCTANEGICSCLNNTMEDCPSAADCYKNQCVKCKENFMGNPVDNQQCYRKISVMQEFLIGSQTAETEDKQVNLLPHGRAIFYAIYPRFTNVDIRMTIDMFAGAVDVYVANENDEFTVIFNETAAQHQVIVKSLAGASRRKRRDTEDDNSDNMVDEVTASNVKLNTFVSYNEYHRALIVRDVRKRLILTFPYGEHQLRDTRFYLVFIGRDTSGSKGLVYFRQDLSQIDLFVFFSVFFSAFFLVVSVSVFGWKIKQYHTRRRVIEVREHQLETMRSRPFATYSFLCQMKRPQPSCWRVKRDTASVLLRDSSLAKDHHLRLRDVRERPVIAPISQEPTADGRACVTTVVFQLPGNECSDFQLLLGSALTVVNHQHPLAGGGDHHVQNGRKFVPRRTVTFTS